MKAILILFVTFGTGGATSQQVPITYEAAQCEAEAKRFREQDDALSRRDAYCVAVPDDMAHETRLPYK